MSDEPSDFQRRIGPPNLLTRGLSSPDIEEAKRLNWAAGDARATPEARGALVRCQERLRLQQERLAEFVGPEFAHGERATISATLGIQILDLCAPLIAQAREQDRQRAAGNAIEAVTRVLAIVEQLPELDLRVAGEWIRETNVHRLAACIGTKIEFKPAEPLVDEALAAAGFTMESPSATVTREALNQASAFGRRTVFFEFELPAWLLSAPACPFTPGPLIIRPAPSNAWGSYFAHPTRFAACPTPGSADALVLVTATHEHDRTYRLVVHEATSHLVPEPTPRVEARVEMLGLLEHGIERELQATASAAGDIFVAWAEPAGVRVAIVDGRRLRSVPLPSARGGAFWLVAGADPLIVWNERTHFGDGRAVVNVRAARLSSPTETFEWPGTSGEHGVVSSDGSIEVAAKVGDRAALYGIAREGRVGERFVADLSLREKDEIAGLRAGVEGRLVLIWNSEGSSSQSDLGTAPATTNEPMLMAAVLADARASAIEGLVETGRSSFGRSTFGTSLTAVTTAPVLTVVTRSHSSSMDADYAHTTSSTKYRIDIFDGQLRRIAGTYHMPLLAERAGNVGWTTELIPRADGSVSLLVSAGTRSESYRTS